MATVPCLTKIGSLINKYCIHMFKPVRRAFVCLFSNLTGKLSVAGLNPSDTHKMNINKIKHLRISSTIQLGTADFDWNRARATRAST